MFQRFGMGWRGEAWHGMAWGGVGRATWSVFDKILSIFSVFDGESDFQIKNKQILHPEATL